MRFAIKSLFYHLDIKFGTYVEAICEMRPIFKATRT